MKINKLGTHIFLIVFCFLVLNRAHSQQNYLPGTIVTLKGDTIN